MKSEADGSLDHRDLKDGRPLRRLPLQKSRAFGPVSSKLFSSQQLVHYEEP